MNKELHKYLIFATSAQSSDDEVFKFISNKVINEFENNFVQRIVLSEKYLVYSNYFEKTLSETVREKHRTTNVVICIHT